MTETLAGDAALACKTTKNEGRVAISPISVKSLSRESAAPSVSGEFNRAALERIPSSFPSLPTTFLLLS